MCLFEFIHVGVVLRVIIGHCGRSLVPEKRAKHVLLESISLVPPCIQPDCQRLQLFIPTAIQPLCTWSTVGLGFIIEKEKGRECVSLFSFFVSSTLAHRQTDRQTLRQAGKQAVGQANVIVHLI